MIEHDFHLGRRCLSAKVLKLHLDKMLNDIKKVEEGEHVVKANPEEARRTR